MVGYVDGAQAKDFLLVRRLAWTGSALSGLVCVVPLIGIQLQRRLLMLLVIL